MQDNIITIFCLCDDLLQALGHHDDGQTRVSGAEIMCVPLIACAHFGRQHGSCAGLFATRTAICVLL